MTFFPRKAISLDDVLGFLSSETIVPSLLGAQLERIEEGRGYDGAGASWEQAYKREMHMLHLARMIRCVEDLRRVSRIGWIAVPEIKSFAQNSGFGEGEAVIAGLRIYQPWASFSEERALAGLYEWMRVRDSKLPPIGSGSGDETVRAFRLGKAKRSRARALGFVRQSWLVLAPWIDRFNGHRRDRVEEAA